MVFKRRAPRSYLQIAADFVYPRGGWRRAGQYVLYRLRRLPDPAYKISRGIAAGVFTSFTPFFGLHFLISASLAWAMRGNIVAALLATFFGNPITFPIIAALSVDLGNFILGREEALPLSRVLSAFSQASQEIWANFHAIFTSAEPHWYQLSEFFSDLFLPYLVGGLIPGLVCAIAAYAASRPLISAYQKARIKRMKASFAKRMAKSQAAKADAGAKAD
ncbi:hypothetical protein SAMN04490244_10534 [Tranquillimonas rosea]|uniref:DUF2062 domain-containing protein n=1 Tax=Tranquillimonas rosea TaxID=641238 RepID=A0A1H9U4K1_9RHOB|nr:DUF2062 domain-containing protein [Tranquillimonas rosea]SES04425.1 hypothetical protein SAMN04490244_10534 [Tranquillimonas rosea]